MEAPSNLVLSEDKTKDNKMIGDDGTVYDIPVLNISDEEIIASKFTHQEEIKIEIDGRTDIKMNDVIGFTEPKKYVKNRLYDYYINKPEYELRGLSPSRGMLLFSMPGCGKTYFIRSVISDLITNSKYVFYQEISADDLMDSRVGKSAEKIHGFFTGMKESAIKTNKDCVIIIDEIDVICPNRSKTSSVLTHERTSQFLKEIDGITENNHIFIIGATNRPWDMDPAALRSGRIEEMFGIEAPDINVRKGLAEKYLNNIPLDPKIDFKLIAYYTENLVGADFKRLGVMVLEKYLETKQPISPKDFTECLEKFKTRSNFFLNQKRIKKWSDTHGGKDKKGEKEK